MYLLVHHHILKEKIILNLIKKLTINRCNRLIQIPMSGIIESYNLATSTGIVFYEICKQRRNFTKK